MSFTENLTFGTTYTIDVTHRATAVDSSNYLGEYIGTGTFTCKVTNSGSSYTVNVTYTPKTYSNPSVWNTYIRIYYTTASDNVMGTEDTYLSTVNAGDTSVNKSVTITKE